MKVFCKCGCGQEVYQNMKAHKTRRANWIKGHWIKKNANINKWMIENEGKHFCICGCGEAIKIRRQHYWTGIPKYIHHHNPVTNWMKGKKHKEESKKKIRENCKGGNKTSFKKCHIPWSKGKERIDIKREKNPNWQGGKSYQGYDRSEFNKRLKRAILKRDNYKCKICGRKKDLFIPLDIHHLDQNKNNNDQDNLITLCHICHSKIHNNISFMEANHQNLYLQ